MYVQCGVLRFLWTLVLEFSNEGQTCISTLAELYTLKGKKKKHLKKKKKSVDIEREEEKEEEDIEEEKNAERKKKRIVDTE